MRPVAHSDVRLSRKARQHSQELMDGHENKPLVLLESDEFVVAGDDKLGLARQGRREDLIVFGMGGNSFDGNGEGRDPGSACEKLLQVGMVCGRKPVCKIRLGKRAAYLSNQGLGLHKEKPTTSPRTDEPGGCRIRMRP